MSTNEHELAPAQPSPKAQLKAQRQAQLQQQTIMLAAIEATMLELVTLRGAAKTICPSEVARALGGAQPDGWGPLMQPVRQVAVRLTHEGKVAILRKGRAVDPDDFKGVYRITLASGSGQQGVSVADQPVNDQADPLLDGQIGEAKPV